MNPKSYRRRSSTSGLKNEMRSWSRNKLQDRLLAMETTKVDRQGDTHRRSIQHDRDVVSKELEQRIAKRTPSVDEYLGKSFGRYSHWQEKERERICRRYKELQRMYNRDFAMLDLDENDPMHGVRRAIIQDKTLSVDVFKPNRRNSDPGGPPKRPETPPIPNEEDSDEEWEQMLQKRETERTNHRPKIKIRSTEDELIEKFAKKSLGK